MIVSVHQPNFLPWIGLFNKIKNSDIFVILDTVQYPRGKTIANKCSIKQGRNKVELIVPISKPESKNGKSNYNNIVFAEPNWNRKVLKSISMSYGNSSYFKVYYSKIEEILNITDFCTMNIEFIQFILKELSIKVDVMRLSQLSSASGKKNDLIISICNELNASVYLSGIGAKKYNDENLYSNIGIELNYNEYSPREYKQVGKGEFISNLSVLDLLFNVGQNGGIYI